MCEHCSSAQVVESDNNSISKVTEYLGNFIYTDGELSTIITEEGRIVPTGDTYRYEYNLKDHLGNTRATFAGTSFGADLIQTTSYYPFGLVMEQENFNTPTANYEKNQYLYNGKELQDEGFGGVELGWLDYGARMYDPAILRFATQDPLAESYYPHSPYNYVGGNPITRIDENGEFWHIVIGAAVGAVASTIKCAIDGEDFRKGSTWAKIGLGTATGAAIAAMPFSVGGVLGAGAVSSASDIMEQGIDNAKEGNELLNKDNYNLKKAAFSGLVASASFGAGGVLARNMRNYAIHRNWAGPLKRNGLLKLLYNYPESSEIIAGTAFSILNTTSNNVKKGTNTGPGEVIVNEGDLDPNGNLKPGATASHPEWLPEIPVYPGSAGPAGIIEYER